MSCPYGMHRCPRVEGPPSSVRLQSDRGCVGASITHQALLIAASLTLLGFLGSGGGGGGGGAASAKARTHAQLAGSRAFKLLLPAGAAFSGEKDVAENAALVLAGGAAARSAWWQRSARRPRPRWVAIAEHCAGALLLPPLLPQLLR
eukprot:363732-Chlamydomonas_euryale.AAC.7